MVIWSIKLIFSRQPLYWLSLKRTNNKRHCFTKSWGQKKLLSIISGGKKWVWSINVCQHMEHQIKARTMASHLLMSPLISPRTHAAESVQTLHHSCVHFGIPNLLKNWRSINAKREHRKMPGSSLTAKDCMKAYLRVWSVKCSWDHYDQ